MADRPFQVNDFLNVAGAGRTLKKYRKNQKVYRQGDPADSVFFVQEGKLKVSVVSEHGKEAVVALHGGGDLSRISWQSKQLKVEWQVRTLAARTV